MKYSFFRVGMIVSIFFTSAASLFAAVPTSLPTGATAGGVFGGYFTNLQTSPKDIFTNRPCNADQVIVGFETLVTTKLFQPKCRDISALLITLAPIVPGKALAGFSSTGAQYVSVSGGGGGPINFACPSGQFVTGFNSVGAPICAGPTYLYYWESGAYGSCSATCGGGTQSRSVICKRNDGIPVADSYCAIEPKPSTSNACNTVACGYRITNITTAAGGGYRATPLSIHKRCVITSVWADWNDYTIYNLRGSDNAGWTIGISDEGGRVAAYANVMCTDDFPGGSLTDGALCTHAGRPGISK